MELLNKHRLKISLLFLFVFLILILLQFDNIDRDLFLYNTQVYGFLYSFLIIIVSGFLYFEQKSNELAHRRFENYHQLIHYVSSGHDTNGNLMKITSQI
jgi:hypothetical protein